MALIKCPNCESEISDKAEKCPQCGWQIKEIPKKLCKECGVELSDTDTVCPKCGCPIIEEKANNKIKSTKIIVIALIVVVAIIGIVYGVKKSQEKTAEKERIEISENYGTNLELASSMMLDGASEAENVGNLIHDVWYNTIYKEYDAKTDKYTQGSYGFNSDFNDSLSKLFEDAVFQMDMDSIKTNQETVKSLMKELKNPPEEYDDAYEALKEYYDAYLELTNLVLSPSGNLQTFTSNFNDADSEVVKRFEAMKMYIE